MLVLAACAPTFALDPLARAPFREDTLTCWSRDTPLTKGWLENTKRDMTICVRTNELVDLLRDRGTARLPIRIDYRATSASYGTTRIRSACSPAPFAELVFPEMPLAADRRPRRPPQTTATFSLEGDEFRVEIDAIIPTIESLVTPSAEGSRSTAGAEHIVESFKVHAVPLATGTGAVDCPGIPAE